MRNYIILNGKNSNTIQGLMIQSLAPITKPMIRTQVEEIDGRDGDIVTPLGYSSYDKTITIGLYGNYDVNEVIEYFNSNGIVTFSNEPDKYYKYQINAQIDFERLIRFKTATVTMHCQPFKYSTTEQPEIMSPTDELLTIPDWQQITNGVTVSCTNGVISVSGTPTSATEFYMPITALALQAGSYTLTASANGQNPNNCSIRMIGTAPSDADSFGNRYISLVQGTTSLSATLATSKTFNYIWFYMGAGATVGFTLTLSVAESAKSVSDEGTYIVLPNTAEAPLKRIDFNGNIQQDTYSGKNLLRYVPKTSADHGITTTYDSDTGTIHVTGTATTSWADISQTINTTLPAGTYTFSVFLTSGSYGKRVVFRPNNIDQYCEINASKTFTISNDITNYRVWINTDAGTTYNFSIRLQVESGSLSTSFEKYVGGRISPNEYFPQIMRVVTGNTAVRICGKNILKLVQLNSASQGITSTISNGVITVSGTTTNIWADITDKPTVNIPAGTYVFSTPEPLPVTLNLQLRWDNGAYADYAIQAGSLSRTIVTTRTAVRLHLYIGGFEAGTNVSAQIRPQLELGSTASSFEAYNEQAYPLYLGANKLAKVGDAEDSIYEQDNNWYIHKETGIMETDGSENVTMAGIMIAIPNHEAVQGSSSLVYCSHAKFKWANEYGACYVSSANEYIAIGVSSVSTTAQAIQWITDNKPVFLYTLKQPTEVQITDENLIEQLNTIKANASSCRGITHITSFATTGNAPHIISAEALAAADGTITNSGNIYSKPKLTIFGSGDIAVYLNNVQMFQIALGDNQYITIDTAALEAYKDTTDNLMNRLVTGDYQNFAFQVGDNTLTFSGTVTECVVENYSRWL